MNGFFIARLIPRLILLFLAYTNTAFAVSNRTFEQERLALIKDAHGVLVNHGICASSNECTKKQLFFVSPESRGLEIEIYAIQDESALAEIVSLCARMFFSHSGKMNVTIQVFSSTKPEQLKQSFFKSTKRKLISFKGEE